MFTRMTTDCITLQDGLTSLMVAADKGYQSIVEALLEGGVDVNYKHQV